MEKQIKSIPWIGNVIQKFEDMCLEVDEVMRQGNDLLPNSIAGQILIFLVELEQSQPSKNLQLFLDNTLKLIASIKAWIDATRDALALFIAHEGKTEPVHETEPVAEVEEQIGRSCVRWCVVAACVTILGFLYI